MTGVAGEAPGETLGDDDGSREQPDRMIGPDVTRALALIGVVVMNYHGYLNGASAGADADSTFAQRLFDPWTGVLSTRFAATFMLVAGVGVTLLTNRSRTNRDRPAMHVDRWRLIRRGLVLYSGGFVLNWIWPGTILFFYGAAFIVAGLIFAARTLWIVTIGASAALSAAAVAWWAATRAADGRYPDWLLFPNTLESRSPRGLLFDTWVNGTHPLLPWLAFMCAGIVVGRSLSSRGAGHARSRFHLRLALIGSLLTAASYACHDLVTSMLSNDEAHDVLTTVLSTRPFDRGLLYSLSTLGSALAAFGLISWVSERWRDTVVITLLKLAGQMTLSIYVAHVLVFNGFVEWSFVGGTGLDTALVFAAVFWLFAIAIAAWWRRFVGIGPLERLYRNVGG